MTRANPITGSFPTVTTEGALLPSELLARIAAGDRALDGLDEASYGLSKGDRFGEAITRSWNRLVAAWAAFQAARAELSEGDPGTTPTRERWLLPLFEELGYGRLPAAHSPEAGGRPFPISHLVGNSPVHLVGCRVPLDRRTRAVVGAATQSPHGLAQEFLNASSAHLWGFVSNGLALRVLRDNATLTRQAYLEFDLESMMEGEQYADFSLLWLICHTSRVAGAKPEECWLERWAKVAADLGRRALDELGAGVRTAMEALGHGFLAHPANEPLRGALRSGGFDRQDYYRELLRLAYRLIFVFAAEDRGLLLDPAANIAAKERYARFYSTARLRRLATRRRGTRHGDLWVSLLVVFAALGRDEGAKGLGVPALGGFLFGPDACPRLAAAQLANSDLLDAVRSLATIAEGRTRRAVDYRNIGSEELGSIYEGLLELHPEVHLDTARFVLGTAAGNERKTSGSYYTPSSLISCLLDSTLDPVLAEAASQPSREQAESAILALRVLDPAAGSGHFLVAAAHRIAKGLAVVRTGDGEPSPEAVRTALRDVIGRCIYAVDVNPMAVELCKVGLWLEALEPGRPLSFLDAHIRCGSSLIGTTPALLRQGIPDAAFDPIAGDEKPVARDLRKRNKIEREGQLTFGDADPRLLGSELAERALALDELPDGQITDLHAKESGFRELTASEDFQRAALLANAWCAAFVGRKAAGTPAITSAVLRQIARDPARLPAPTLNEIRQIAEEYQFFHWHVEFPDVFRLIADDPTAEGEGGGWSGGFDCVLGNPPWERVKLQDQEFFAERSPEIAEAPNAAARKGMITALEQNDPDLWSAYTDALRRAEGESHFLRNSGRFPMTGRGDINTYAVFAETFRLTMGPLGGAGIIVPTGIATDDTTKAFFEDLIRHRQLTSVIGFENEEHLFPGVDHRVRFCLLALTGSDRPAGEVDLMFFARQVADLACADRHFVLTPDDFALVNPNTRTCPICRSTRDADLMKAVYRRVPVLIDESHGDEANPWGVSFMRMLDMANDSGLFRSSGQLEGAGWRLDGNGYRRADERYLPLYEAKMIHQFDHRFGTYDGQTEAQAKMGKLPELADSDHQDASLFPLPRYWVPESEIVSPLDGRWDGHWLLGWRDICRSTDERTVIANVIPRVGVGNKFLLALPARPPGEVACMLANLNSFALDYVSRQKTGGTSLSYFILKQLPVLPPFTYHGSTPWRADGSMLDWIVPRVCELSDTAWDLEAFGRDLGWSGPPFRWDADRRFLMRCELDAAFFHLYGMERDHVDYILGTFPIVQRKDEKRYGEFRTRRTILDVFDAMAEAIRSGQRYETLLDPPPGDPSVAHSPRPGEQPGHWVPVEPEAFGRPTRLTAAPHNPGSAEPSGLYPIGDRRLGAEPTSRVAEGRDQNGGSSAPGAPRTAASVRPIQKIGAGQPTLDDLTRAAVEPHGWIQENGVEANDVQPGWQARHRSFGQGVVVWVRVQGRNVSYVIRFSGGDHEIATGYGLLELRPPDGSPT